ncbi:MAG: TldD/PmbA family protein [Veillonellales bacterium]
MEYLSLANAAVQIAKRMGSYAAEAYVLDAKSLTIEVANNELETLKFSEDRGIGLRVISDRGTVGFAYSTNFNQLGDLAGQALANSQYSFTDPYHGLPQNVSTNFEIQLWNETIAAATVEEKIEMAKQIEQSAQAADSRITRTERCGYEDAAYGVALANSNGLAHYYRSGYCGLYGVVLAEQNGDVQTGTGLLYTRNFAKLNPEEVGKEAAWNAGLLLGAKRIHTVKAAVVLPPYIAASFCSVLIPALCADSVQKGRSIFKNKLGQKVVSSLFTLTDDGRLADGIATCPVDGEGVPTGKHDLIIDGVLNQYLYNTYTAKKDGVSSTGNGMRGSFKTMPEVGPTNIYIQPGTTPREKLIAEVQNGFYVTNVMGMHTANPISGDFSVGAAGVWIKNGQMTQPVRGVAIAGNILDLFAGIDGVGNDLRFFGAKGAPTLRLDRVTVSGS